MEDTTKNNPDKNNLKVESINTTTNVNKTCESTNTITTTTSSEKVKIHLVAVGSAPLLKKNKFLFDSNQSFASIYTFLKKILKINDNDSSNDDNNDNNDNNGSSNQSLYLYCNSAFIPSLDERIGDLNDCFNVRGELVVNYSYQEAWG